MCIRDRGFQGIAEEARHRAVGMELVHEVIVGIQIAVDERHTASGTGHHIQPPIGVGIFIGFHFVAKVALQIGFRIGGKFQAPLDVYKRQALLSLMGAESIFFRYSVTALRSNS